MPDLPSTLIIASSLLLWAKPLPGFREFSNEFDSAIATLRGLSIECSGGNADLTQLFRVAAREAKESRA